MIETSAHYLGEKGKEYFSGRFDERQNFGRRYQSRYFAPHCSPDKVLLDYGCGDGTILRQMPAVKKFGVEVNPFCRNKIRQLNENLSCPITVFDSIESIDDDSVDVAISNHCLEHVPHPFTVLSELKRVLVPGGRLVLVTPFDDWRQKGQGFWTPGDKDNHLYTWNPMNLGNLLVEAGLSVHDVRLCTTAWSPRIFWIHRFFGEAPFRLACYMIARLTQRREILCVASKP